MAARPICVGIKTDGVPCNKNAVVGEERCRTHLNTVHNHGPNATALKELRYTHTRRLAELAAQWNIRIDAEVNRDVREALLEDYDHELQVARIQNRHELDLLRRSQQERIRQTGIDPDAEANRRRHAIRDERRRDQWRHVEEEQAIIRARWRARQFLDGQHQAVVRPVVQQQQDGELARFAHDNQNIHTTRAVNMTKQMVTTILTIPVPEEYKWNPRECSKTPGDIIMSCRLTPKAAWQMAAKYCQDETIYDLENGIYGKVLDGVWQFILKSPDKSDLCRVLKQEMEDNIGMCAQGNLSRLCNILAGYMDGIGSQESIADILGRLMPKLMEIEDLSRRLMDAHQILKENKIPVSQWKTWLDPLMSDQDVEMTVGFIRNAQDEIVGFMAVEV